ncbi:hypothetical protein DB30_00958 [Enhygromyxa salina]|uniref:Uncharacterized protein n=1 Tax=Enhygromyxa salina TaxID=215803 RepID=A0A0C2CTA5_9BACT|nr:hypothetical protein [Enhygromyxa salina]KIG12840.1 hypothetical protein DB30_00958 [Enhygromyxa salina]
MKHTTPVTICLLALACTAKKAAPAAESGGDANAQPDAQVQPAPAPPETLSLPLPSPIVVEAPPIAADQAVVFEQVSLGIPSRWRFKPGGKEVAELLERGCGTWSLDSGNFLGTSPSTATDPCHTGAPLAPLVWAANKLSIAGPGGQGTLRVEGDHFELSAPALKGQASEGQRYQAAAFSPNGARLALFVSGTQGSSLQIWNLASAQLERTLSFAITPGEDQEPGPLIVERVWLEWTARSLVALADAKIVSSRDYGDPERVAFAQVWRSIERKPVEFRFNEHDGDFITDVERFYLDPEHRWLFAVLAGIIPDDGSDAKQVEGINLTTGSQLALSGDIWLADEEDEPAPVPRQAGAAPDQIPKPTHTWQGTSAWELKDYDSGYDFGGGWEWSVTSLVPMPNHSIALARGHGIVEHERLAEGETMSVGLVGGGKISSTLVLCDEDQDEPCEGGSALPPGCEAIDASFDFAQLLLACDDRWLLMPMPALGEPVEIAGAHEFARGAAAPRRVVWSPAGMAIWTAANGLRLFHDKPKTDGLDAVTALHRVILDDEVGLALVEKSGELHILDLERAKLGPPLAWTGPIEFAAFAPYSTYGDRLALAGGGTLAVFSVFDSEPGVRWSTQDLAGVAFRQDGQALYVGVNRPVPELTLDPFNGELLANEQLDRVVLDRLAAAGLDPTWRWAIEHNGALMRTLDGQALLVAQSDQALAESGYFEGEPNGWELARHRVRVGPPASGTVHTLAELAGRLKRSGLVADFLRGDFLPRPRMSAPDE